jgi:alkylation response protein AidB-like acyl-CoA dehydrogenase
MTAIFGALDRDLGLNDLEEELVLQLGRIVEREIAPRAEAYDRSGAFPWDNIRTLNGLGMNGVFIPAEHGGTPTSYRCFLRLVEVLSRGCASTANTWATTFNAIHPLLVFGTEEQKAKYLPRIADGGLAAIAITEPSGGSDVLALQSTLTPDSTGDFVLRGGKSFITNGNVADLIVVFAKIPELRTPREQLTALLLEPGTPGLVVGKSEAKLGYRASATVSLHFDECIVPRENVLGGVGQGFTVLLAMLNRSRPCVSAQAIGIGGAAFDEAVRYVNHRTQFGQRILDFQGVQFMIADMASKLALARSWLWRVGALVDEGPADDFDIEASILKVAASDAAMSIATNAVQLHGGAGYMTGTKVERLYRDAKLTQIFEGANELHRARIGRSFLDRRGPGT